MGVAGGLVEAVGEDVGEGVAFGGVAGPAGGSVPAGAVAGGVDVEGDEEDVGGALGCADGVGAANAFFEGDVFGFGDRGVGRCGLCCGGLRGFGWRGRGCRRIRGGCCRGQLGDSLGDARSGRA